MHGQLEYDLMLIHKLYVIQIYDELAVIVVHKSIHLMNLWKMNQQSDEPIRAFAARVTATADMCGMSIKCTNATCGQDIIYRDHVCFRSSYTACVITKYVSVSSAEIPQVNSLL